MIQKFFGTDTEDDEDVEMADAGAFTPDSASRVPRSAGTRRQTVHVSHDSLFSSMEISDSGSASTITGIPTRLSGASTTTDRNTGNELSSHTALTSAMSLTGILDPTDTNKLLTLGQPFEPTHDDAAGFDWMADDERVSNALAGDKPKDRRAHKKSVACLDDLEILGAKVSEMNLEGLVPMEFCFASKY
jgi:hypothetical protein